MADKIEPCYLNRYCAECGSMLDVEPVFVSDAEHKWSVTCRECNSTFFIDGKYRIYTWAPNSDIVQEKAKKRRKKTKIQK